MVSRPPRIKKTKSGRLYFVKYGKKHYFKREDDFKKVLNRVMRRHQKKRKKVKHHKKRKRKIRRKRTEKKKPPVGIPMQPPVSAAYTAAVTREQEISRFELGEKQKAERKAMTELQRAQQIQKDKEIAIAELYGNDLGVVPTIKQIQDVFFDKEKRTLDAEEAVTIQEDIRRKYAADQKKTETLQKQAETLEKERIKLEEQLKQKQEDIKKANVILTEREAEIAKTNIVITEQGEQLTKSRAELREARQRQIADSVNKDTVVDYLKSKDWQVPTVAGSSKPESRFKMIKMYGLDDDPDFIEYHQKKHPKYTFPDRPKTTSPQKEPEAPQVEPPKEPEEQEPEAPQVKPPKEPQKEKEPEAPKEKPPPKGGDEGPSLFQFGAGDNGGLSNIEIDQLMAPFRDFHGTYAIDQIKQIPVKDKFGFVINTEPIKVPTGHWCGVWVDANKDKSIEWFDPFGDSPPKRFDKDIKHLINKIQPNDYLKYKVNRIVSQDDRSDNCGWISMNFLLERMNGKKFKEVTGYNIAEGERKAELLKQKFNYI